MLEETKFGKQLLQLTPKSKKVMKRRIGCFLAALTWLAIGIFIIIYGYDGWSNRFFVVPLVLSLPIALCLWGTFRRDYGTTLVLYEQGFSRVIPRRNEPKVESFSFSEVKGSRCVWIIGKVFDRNKFFDRTRYIDSASFARPAKRSGFIAFISKPLRAIFRGYDEYLSILLEMKNPDVCPFFEIITTLDDRTVEQFFVRFDDAFAKYLLKDVTSENLHNLNISFGDHWKLEQGHLVFTKSQNPTMIPIDTITTILAPHPKFFTERSILKLMGVPDKNGISEELAHINIDTALNISALFAIVKMNRENRSAIK